MSTSQNGWPVITSADSPYLHRWVIPASNGTSSFLLRRGSAGFLLSHFILWFAENVEPIKGPVLDDWGWADRNIIGFTTVSNHASATAADVNALQHGLGETSTFTAAQVKAIRDRLALYQNCLRHGLFYATRPDPMHVEINRPLADCEALARVLMNSPRGKRLLDANPGQKAVILA